MTFDANNLDFLSTNWFLLNGKYEGDGYAEFSNPPGTARGSFKIVFDEFGQLNCEMTNIDVEPKVKDPFFDIEDFFEGEGKIHNEDGTFIKLLGKRLNKCTKIEIITKEGCFIADRNIHYSLSISIHQTKTAKLSFHLLLSQFDTNNAEEAKYWVLPLFNFLSNYSEYSENLNFHALRLQKNPIVPCNLSQIEKTIAGYNMNVSNRLILFEFNDGIGFVEKMPDYEERKKDLETRAKAILITAIMVGEVGTKCIDLDDLKEWFPFGFLLLLSFVTGVKVGSPWIEFRDAQGGLVRRLHVNVYRHQFSKSHRVIDEGLHMGTGKLLTCSQKSKYYGKKYLQVVLNHLIDGSLQTSFLENQLSYLCRALDTLCEDLDKENLKPQDKENSRKLKKIISSAVNDIKEIAKTYVESISINSSEEKKELEFQTLDKIANQIEQFKGGVKQGYGKTVLELMQKFNLPDGSIVEEYYKAKPRTDRKRWEEVLSMYRGKVIHLSYFDFNDDKYSVEDIIRFTEHIHDILTRIVFQMLGYEGTYQPILIKMPVDAPFDWVKPTTPACQLGY